MGIEGKFDPDPTYELTMDNVKKILAIDMRFRFYVKPSFLPIYIQNLCVSSCHLLFILLYVYRSIGSYVTGCNYCTLYLEIL